ncbi:unnamed protein product [Malus baccata var. baccata]
MCSDLSCGVLLGISGQAKTVFCVLLSQLMNMRFDSCWDGAGTFWVCNKVSRRVYQRTNHKYRHVSAPCFETAMIERNKHKIIIGYHRSYILNCNARIQWTCCCNAFDEYKASLA